MSRPLPPPITALSDSEDDRLITTAKLKSTPQQNGVKDLPLAPTASKTCNKRAAVAQAKAKGKATDKAKDKGTTTKAEAAAAPASIATAPASEAAPASAAAPAMEQGQKRKTTEKGAKKPCGKKTAKETLAQDTVYVLMNYKKHGVNGTWAVRKRGPGGTQVCEINVPTTDEKFNKEIAEAVLNELNKGISEQDAKTLASKLKDAMMKRLDAEPHGKDTAKDAGVAQ